MVLCVDIRSLLYLLVNVFHPDWLIRSNYWLRTSDNLYKESHQNLRIHQQLTKKKLHSSMIKYNVIQYNNNNNNNLL